MAAYLQDMSTLGTWDNHIIIQAVANANKNILTKFHADNCCDFYLRYWA